MPSIKRRKSTRSLPPLRAEQQLGESIAIQAQMTVTAAQAGDDGKPKGRPTVTINAYNGGVIRVPGYYRPVVLDLDGLQGVGAAHPLYRNHDRDRIVGHGTTTRDGNALNTAGKLSANNADTEEIVSLAAEEFPWQASVGVQPTRLEQVEPGSSVTVNGQTITGPATIVRAGDLYEVSIVSVGADKTTSTRVAAEQPGVTDMNFSAWLKAKGFVEAELSEGQLKSLKAMYEAEQSDGDGAGSGTAGNPGGGNGSGSGGSSVDVVLQAARDREARHAAYGGIIQAAIERGLNADTAERLVEAAKKDNMSETEFELTVLRASRHEGSDRAFSGRGNDRSPLVIEAALARSCGVDVEKVYEEQVLAAADRQYKHGTSVVEIMQVAARANGYHNISSRDVKALLEAAFAPVQAKGASTYDVGGILSNVANKMIVNAFMAVEQEWTKIATVESVNDLKKHTSYALTGDFEYKELGKGGEISHATMGEEEYEKQASSYGRLFVVTEDDMINDDLSAFTRIRRLLGRGAALAQNKVIWTAFLAEVATFWTAARNNYISGASTALSVDALTAAVTKFKKQTDPDSNPLGLAPKVLAVPVELEVEASRLVNDGEIRVVGASSKETYTTKNPHAGKYTLCSSQYLNSDAIPNGSATHWFMLGDPDDLPTLCVVFLNGQRTPRVESGRPNFDTLAIGFRGVHRFGANKQEHRASVRSKGAA